ncbi:hypothetical protein EVAR_80471_1 [Eumeta japonica]|uniref:Uncharacterized protein n=1 Tax=Eumeta variegata TaxID=151549 RepID=A0A4C1YQP2_EUMVA|nr:hypothetical protein EVAR_80471_1 [Eumeta japonica]
MKQHSIVGNKKKISSTYNSDQITVIGNRCIVIVGKNFGCIEVVGNRCRIEVEENYGSVSMTGSHSVLVIRKRGKGDAVQVTGASCRLLANDTDDYFKGYEAQISPFTATMNAILDPVFNFTMRYPVVMIDSGIRKRSGRIFRVKLENGCEFQKSEESLSVSRKRFLYLAPELLLKKTAPEEKLANGNHELDVV